jgi:NhaA family Na+:H+ antiporter
MSGTISQLPEASPVGRIVRPFQAFAQAEAAGGIVLLVAAVVALLWANSPWEASYTALWHSSLSFSFGNWWLSKPLESWINDGLMTLFFFLVGLEIKREILGGELTSMKRATLPVAAALGGMLVPAGIYLAFNAGRTGAVGWGIPMATDIAFALGVLTLLGKRAPLGLKVLLTALAIVDDIGAILVIALFYNPGIEWAGLITGMGFLLALVAANRLGVRQPLVYSGLGAGLWLAILFSGVHPAIAGVMAALTIPAQSRIQREEFLDNGQALLEAFAEAEETGEDRFISEEQQSAIQALEQTCERVDTPLQRMERALHPWVAFGVVPLFAFANAGIPLGTEFFSALTHPIGLGVLVGLVVGKQLGITLFSWAAVKGRVAVLPTGVTWWHIYGMGWLAGIGFTVSLFIANLAFVDPELVAQAKAGILMAATVVMSGIGWVLLRRTLPAEVKEKRATGEPEEAS